MDKKSSITLISSLALLTAAVAIYGISKSSKKDKLLLSLGSKFDILQNKMKGNKIIPICEKYEWKAD